MITTKIIFDRKKQIKKHGTGTLEIRLTVARHAYYISTGVRVRDKEWKVGRIVNRPDSDTLNDRLATIYEIVEREANRCIKNGQPINIEAIKSKIWPEKDAMSSDHTFLDWLDHQTEILNLSEGTIKHYVTLHTRLVEFGRIMTWEDITAENVCEFDAWLHKRKLSTGEAITDAAVYKYHKCFKAILNRALIFDKIEKNPYEKLKFRRGESENIEYLTEDEMKKIQKMRLPKDSPIAIARDLFIFQMFTGLAYSDTQSFDFSKYKKVKGKWINTGERMKTGVPYISSLLPPVVAVLEKYNFRVPKIDNSDYNQLLKLIGSMAGIETKMHTHLARHTFATYMLKQGVKVENLRQMLGHKNIRQTMRYAKVMAESVHEDFNMVAEKMMFNPKK